VHVERFEGNGERTPVVLLHGFGSGSFTWGPAIAAGLLDGRPGLAFDRFGFGRSERPAPGDGKAGEANPYTVAGAAQLTEALIDKSAVLVGHSAGALVALATALRAPAKVRGLVLIAPAVLGTGGPPPPIDLLFRVPLARRWAPPFLRAGRPLLGRSVATAWHDPGRLHASGLAAAYAAAAREPGWAEGLVELTLAADRAEAHAVVDRLADVHQPVLVIEGAHDRLVSKGDIGELTKRLAHATTIVVPDSGHVPHEEQPEAVVRAVTPFLEMIDDLS
jgi:pimeloyl-ACP methyl ester carboxylesterase